MFFFYICLENFSIYEILEEIKKWRVKNLLGDINNNEYIINDMLLFFFYWYYYFFIV